MIINGVWLYALVSVFVVSIISLIGVFTLGINVEKMKKILIYLISFSAGALFGDAFIHLFPEIIKDQGWTLNVSLYLLSGILIFFILEKIVHYQHYHCHGEECEKELQEEVHESKNHKIHSFAYMSLIGSSLHNFIDGMIIAASYLISIPVGLATTIAVVLHEIPHELGDFSILIHGGFTRNKALFINFLSALIAFLGMGVTLLLNSSIGNLKLILIPIAAGGFIYIAGSDLIPELHKESGLRTSIVQVVTFIIGILLMAVLLMLG